MFRIESETNLSNDGADKVANGRSRVQSDVGFSNYPEGIDGEGLLFEKNGGPPSKRTASLNIQPTPVGCAVPKSQSVSEEVFESEGTNGRMTDEMRELRFNRIVKENLEKYPLDYDRLRLQKEAETLKHRGKERSKGFHRKAPKDESSLLRSRGPDCSSHGPSCTETDGSSMEPDAFWRTLNDDHWNETDARLSGGSLSDGGGTPVQGNSLPRDSWMSPPVAPELSAASTAFPAVSNDHVTCELEGQLHSFCHLFCFFTHSAVLPFLAVCL